MYKKYILYKKHKTHSDYLTLLYNNSRFLPKNQSKSIKKAQYGYKHNYNQKNLLSFHLSCGITVNFLAKTACCRPLSGVGPKAKLQLYITNTVFLNKKQTPPFFNITFDKGRLKNLVSWTLEKYGQYKTVELLEQLKKTGFDYATKAGISLGIDDLKIPPKKNTLLLEAEQLTKLTVHQYQRADITAVERFQRLIDTWHRTSEQLKQEVINYFEETNVLNPVYMMAFSGARGNISQVRQLVGMRGLMSDPQGQIIDFPIRSNFREGLTLTEYIISSYGARKGIVDTALRTANAGYLTRRLVDVAQHVIISHYDCGTQKGVFLTDMKEGNKTIVSAQNRIIGRVLARDIYKPNTNIKIASRNQEISTDLAFEITKITNRIFVRSALTCNTTKLLCQLCYGWSLAQGNLVSVGEAVGVIAAQSIGEPGTQLTMRTFHTGGVFSGDVSDEIRAPYDGFVYYEKSIPGILIRALDGKILFLTKSDGTLIFSTNQIIDNHKNNAQDDGFNKLKTGQLHIKKYKIPAYTVLFIRNGESVFQKQVVAQITSIRTKPNLRDTAELIIKSELEGLFYAKKLHVKKKVIGPKPKFVGFAKQNLVLDAKAMEIVVKARGWNFAWVLSGKRYELPLLLKSFPITGDYLTPQTVITRHQLKLQNNYKLKLNITNKACPKYLQNVTLLRGQLLSNLTPFKFGRQGNVYGRITDSLQKNIQIDANTTPPNNIFFSLNTKIKNFRLCRNMSKYFLTLKKIKLFNLFTKYAKKTKFSLQPGFQKKNKDKTNLLVFNVFSKNHNRLLANPIPTIHTTKIGKYVYTEKIQKRVKTNKHAYSYIYRNSQNKIREKKNIKARLKVSSSEKQFMFNNIGLIQTTKQKIKLKQDLLFLNLKKIFYHKIGYFNFFNTQNTFCSLCRYSQNKNFDINLLFLQRVFYLNNVQQKNKIRKANFVTYDNKKNQNTLRQKYNLENKKAIKFYYNKVYNEVMLAPTSLKSKTNLTKAITFKRFKSSNYLLEWFSSSTTLVPNAFYCSNNFLFCKDSFIKTLEDISKKKQEFKMNKRQQASQRRRDLEFTQQTNNIEQNKNPSHATPQNFKLILTQNRLKTYKKIYKKSKKIFIKKLDSTPIEFSTLTPLLQKNKLYHKQQTSLQTLVFKIWFKQYKSLWNKQQKQPRFQLKTQIDSYLNHFTKNIFCFDKYLDCAVQKSKPQTKSIKATLYLYYYRNKHVLLPRSSSPYRGTKANPLQFPCKGVPLCSSLGDGKAFIPPTGESTDRKPLLPLQGKDKQQSFPPTGTKEPGELILILKKGCIISSDKLYLEKKSSNLFLNQKQRKYCIEKAFFSLKKIKSTFSNEKTQRKKHFMFYSKRPKAVDQTSPGFSPKMDSYLYKTTIFEYFKLTSKKYGTKQILKHLKTTSLKVAKKNYKKKLVTFDSNLTKKNRRLPASSQTKNKVYPQIPYLTFNSQEKKTRVQRQSQSKLKQVQVRTSLTHIFYTYLHKNNIALLKKIFKQKIKIKKARILKRIFKLTDKHIKYICVYYKSKLKKNALILLLLDFIKRLFVSYNYISPHIIKKTLQRRKQRKPQKQNSYALLGASPSKDTAVTKAFNRNLVEVQALVSPNKILSNVVTDVISRKASIKKKNKNAILKQIVYVVKKESNFMLQNGVTGVKRQLDLLTTYSGKALYDTANVMNSCTVCCAGRPSLNSSYLINHYITTWVYKMALEKIKKIPRVFLPVGLLANILSPGHFILNTILFDKNKIKSNFSTKLKHNKTNQKTHANFSVLRKGIAKQNLFTYYKTKKTRNQTHFQLKTKTCFSDLQKIDRLLNIEKNKKNLIWIKNKKPRFLLKELFIKFSEVFPLKGTSANPLDTAFFSNCRPSVAPFWSPLSPSGGHRSPKKGRESPACISPYRGTETTGRKGFPPIGVLSSYFLPSYGGSRRTGKGRQGLSRPLKGNIGGHKGLLSSYILSPCSGRLSCFSPYRGTKAFPSPKGEHRGTPLQGNWKGKNYGGSRSPVRGSPLFPCKGKDRTGSRSRAARSRATGSRGTTEQIKGIRVFKDTVTRANTPFLKNNKPIEIKDKINKKTCQNIELCTVNLLSYFSPLINKNKVLTLNDLKNIKKEYEKVKTKNQFLSSKLSSQYLFFTQVHENRSCVLNGLEKLGLALKVNKEPLKHEERFFSNIKNTTVTGMSEIFGKKYKTTNGLGRPNAIVKENNNNKSRSTKNKSGAYAVTTVTNAINKNVNKKFYTKIIKIAKNTNNNKLQLNNYWNIVISACTVKVLSFSEKNYLELDVSLRKKYTKLHVTSRLSNGCKAITIKNKLTTNTTASTILNLYKKLFNIYKKGLFTARPTLTVYKEQKNKIIRTTQNNDKTKTNKKFKGIRGVWLSPSGKGRHVFMTINELVNSYVLKNKGYKQEKDVNLFAKKPNFALIISSYHIIKIKEEERSNFTTSFFPYGFCRPSVVPLRGNYRPSMSSPFYPLGDILSVFPLTGEQRACCAARPPGDRKPLLLAAPPQQGDKGKDRTGGLIGFAVDSSTTHAANGTAGGLAKNTTLSYKKLCSIKKRKRIGQNKKSADFGVTNKTQPKHKKCLQKKIYFTKNLIYYNKPSFFDFYFKNPSYCFTYTVKAQKERTVVSNLKNKAKKLLLIPKQPCLNICFYSKYSSYLNSRVFTTNLDNNIENLMAFNSRAANAVRFFSRKFFAEVSDRGAQLKRGISFNYHRDNIIARRYYFSPFEGELVYTKIYKNYLDLNPYENLKTGLMHLNNYTNQKTKEEKMRMAMFKYYLKTINKFPIQKKVSQKAWSRFNLILTKKDLMTLNYNQKIEKTMTVFSELQKTYTPQQSLRSTTQHPSNIKSAVKKKIITTHLGEIKSLETGLVQSKSILINNSKKGFLNSGSLRKSKVTYSQACVNKFLLAYINNNLKIQTIADLNKENIFNKAYIFNLKNKWLKQNFINSLNKSVSYKQHSLVYSEQKREQSPSYYTAKAVICDIVISQRQLPNKSNKNWSKDYNIKIWLPNSALKDNTNIVALTKYNKHKQACFWPSDNVMPQAKHIYYVPYNSIFNLKWINFKQKNVFTKNKVGFFFLKGNTFFNTTSKMTFNKTSLNSKIYDFNSKKSFFFNQVSILQDSRYLDLQICLELQKLHLNKNFLKLKPLLDKVTFKKFTYYKNQIYFLVDRQKNKHSFYKKQLYYTKYKSKQLTFLSAYAVNVATKIDQWRTQPVQVNNPLLFLPHQKLLFYFFKPINTTTTVYVHLEIYACNYKKHIYIWENRNNQQIKYFDTTSCQPILVMSKMHFLCLFFINLFKILVNFKKGFRIAIGANVIFLDNWQKILFLSEEKNQNKIAESVQVLKKSGQLIHMNKQKITLRLGQPLVISPRSIIHASQGDFIRYKTSVITLTYQQLKTGDIVQGIPKVEQLFEARTTKRGRLFRDNVTNLLTGLFLKYFVKSAYLLRKNMLDISKKTTTAYPPQTLLKQKTIPILFVNDKQNQTILLALALHWSVKQSFYKIQQIIVDGILRVYRSQGVCISDKHVEIIVKQMTSKVRIINPNASKLTDFSFSLENINRGLHLEKQKQKLSSKLTAQAPITKSPKRKKIVNTREREKTNIAFETKLLEQLLSNNLDGPSGLFPGEMVDIDFVENINIFLFKTSSIESLNTENQTPYAIEPIKYEPIVLGITRASLEVESFLSAASFQQTTRVLSQAALYKKKDFLKGLKENIIIGNLIPAGTGYLSSLNVV